MLDLPIILQCNKQDIPDAIKAPALQEIMQINGCPFYESIAIQGKGVFETLKAITCLVVEAVQSEVS